MPGTQTHGESEKPTSTSREKPKKASAAAKRKTAGGAHKAPASAPDAIELLIQDHREAQAMFKEFDKIKESDNEDAKLELAENICLAFLVHAAIEEEIFYPAIAKAIEDDDIIDESLVEHQAAKDLIAEIEGMEPEEELFNARVHVLGEEVNHHIKEEEGEMFPEVRKTKLDLKELGRRLAERKQELMEEWAGE